MHITKRKIRICAPNISELGLLSSVFEVLVTHSKNSLVHVFVCSQRVMFSFKFCSRIRHKETSGCAASISTHTVLSLFPLLQVVLEQPLLSLYFIYFFTTLVTVIQFISWTFLACFHGKLNSKIKNSF